MTALPLHGPDPEPASTIGMKGYGTVVLVYFKFGGEMSADLGFRGGFFGMFRTR